MFHIKMLFLLFLTIQNSLMEEKDTDFCLNPVPRENLCEIQILDSAPSFNWQKIKTSLKDLTEKYAKNLHVET